MDAEVVGAIKVKDGLFVGDEFAAQDLEFVVANKVTHVINCAGRQVKNHWEPIGVRYLTFFWLDVDSQIILDPKDQVADECCKFIEEALGRGDSVLVHSVKGQSRACTVLSSYIMRKYRWALLKTLEFLNSRRPDLEIRAAFIHQLTAYENRLVARGLGPKTSKWTEVFDKATNEFENEELLLRNTYLNAQMGPFADYSVGRLPDKPAKIRWVDETTKNAKPLASFIEPKEDTNKGSPEAKVEEKKPMIVLTKTPIASRNGKNPSETVPANPNDKNKEPKVEARPQISARESTEVLEKQVQSQNFRFASNPSQNQRAPVEKTRPATQPSGDVKKEGTNERRNEEKIKELLRPKYNNYVREDVTVEENKRPVNIEETGQKNATKVSKRGITQIINQNNINNFIINNPQKVELIEFSPAKAQHIPELKTAAMMRFHQSVAAPPTINPPPAQSTIKKIVAAKKVSAQPRSSSAAVRREPQKPVLAEGRDRTRVKERPKPDTNAILEKSLKGGLVGPIIRHHQGTNPLQQVRNGPIRASVHMASKIPPPRGETPDQPHPPVKIIQKTEKPRGDRGIKKPRPASPGIFLKSSNPSNTIKTISGIKKSNMRSISPRQVPKSTGLGRGISPGKGKWKS